MKKNSRIVGLHLTITKIILNVNGLNVPIKKQRLSDWIKQQELTIWYLHKQDTL